MADVWIEAALNGPWGRARQPGAPVAVAEIVADGLACVDAGAAIIHVHAFDVATGRQRDEWEIYARIIEGIRAKADVVVYPTVPLAGSGFAEDTTQRFAHTVELAERGLIEWTVVDPGSVNFARFAQIDDPAAAFVYQNSPADIGEGMRISREYGVRPGFAIYEPGFTRLGAALAARQPDAPTPVYRFMFSDEFAWGFPPQAPFLDAHLGLLAQAAPGAPWMVAGLGVDITPLIAPTVARGGHVRVGLEDAPWGSQISNRAWVESAAREIRAAGGEPATAKQVRATLAGIDRARAAQP